MAFIALRNAGGTFRRRAEKSEINRYWASQSQPIPGPIINRYNARPAHKAPISSVTGQNTNINPYVDNLEDVDPRHVIAGVASYVAPVGNALHAGKNEYDLVLKRSTVSREQLLEIGKRLEPYGFKVGEVRTPARLNRNVVVQIHRR